MDRDVSRHVLRETPRNLVLTDRDKGLLRDLATHRALTADWLARAHFGGSERTCWERMRKLIAGGYVEKLETEPRRPKAYRATRKAKGAVGVPTGGRPSKGLEPAQLRHTLAIGEVAWRLLDRYRGDDGVRAGWITEYQLRRGRGRDFLPRGLYPDGVLVVDDGCAVSRVAVEVEVSRKEAHLYAPKLRAYRRALDDGGIAQARWYVPTTTDGAWLRREALLPAGFPKEDERMAIALLPEHRRDGR